MSTAGVRDTVRDAFGARENLPVTLASAAAGACVAIVVATYLAVLYDVVTVVGNRWLFVAVVAAAVGLAGVLRALPWKYAIGLSGVLLTGGLAAYLLTVPPAYFDAMSPTRLVMDTVALLTGYSVLRIPAAGSWAVAVAPAPTFLAAYFAFRQQYARAVTIAAVALGFFVLTGDSTTTATAVGVVAAAGAIGFSTLAEHDASGRQAQVLAVVLAVMIVGSATVTAVPGGASPLVPASSTTTAGSLVSTGGYVGIGGSLRLEPRVQFTVNANEPSYYRAGVYDRYTGDGWVQTGDVGSLENPPPTGETIEQRITAERTLDLLPAAAVPRSVDGVDAEISEGGLLSNGPTLYEGDSYEVRSRTPTSNRAALADQTGETPTRVGNTYLQLPDSTDDRVVDLAASLTEDADSNFEKARAVEQWLEANKEYSLDAPNPDGDLVNEFVLGDIPGYCTYYASAMAVMLRSQDVPARYVTGYTPGQRVAEDEWVVRGLDSHAWVEVYIPETGWVRFDPTPATERSSAEQERITDARESDVDGVDTAGSENGTWTPPETREDEFDNISDGDFGPQSDESAIDAPNERTPASGNFSNITAPGAGENAGGDSGGDGASRPSLPPLSTLAIWSVLLVGAIAGLRYTGLPSRAYRALWLRWLPNGSAAEEVEAAFQRAEYVMEQRYRQRKPGETVRDFVASVRADDREQQVAALRERARYAGRVTDEDAAEAKRLARSLAAEYSRLPDPRR